MLKLLTIFFLYVFHIWLRHINVAGEFPTSKKGGKNCPQGSCEDIFEGTELWEFSVKAFQNYSSSSSLSTRSLVACWMERIALRYFSAVWLRPCYFFPQLQQWRHSLLFWTGGGSAEARRVCSDSGMICRSPAGSCLHARTFDLLSFVWLEDASEPDTHGHTPLISQTRQSYLACLPTQPIVF